MRACIVFSDIGHYHHARFAAASSCIAGKLSVLEVGGESSYGEFKSMRTGENAYLLRTLFQGVRYIDAVSGRKVAPADLRGQLIAELNTAAPEVLILKGYSFLDSLIALAWAREKRVPVVVMSESHAGDFERVAWKEWLKRQLMRDVSAALVGGRPHARYMHSLGVPRDRIFMGYDVVDNDHFGRGADHARNSAREMRARHGLPERYILASGRFIPKKDFATLVRAFARYRSQVRDGERPAWDLVILGDGEERAFLERLRDELNLRDAVHLPGFRGYDDLPAFYGLADAFVHPSEREQWGLVVNEAMACGLPVLLTDKCGCAEDLVIDGKTGFQFPVGDVEILGEHLLRLWRNDDRRRAMGMAARRRIASFSPEAFARGLEKACHRALESPRWGSRAWQRFVGMGITQRAIRFPTDENLS